MVNGKAGAATKPKKSMAEQVKAEEEKQMDDFENKTFPKIAAETTIESCTKKQGGVAVKFGELNFSGNQFEQISDWIDDGAVILVTLEQRQGTF